MEDHIRCFLFKRLKYQFCGEDETKEHGDWVGESQKEWIRKTNISKKVKDSVNWVRENCRYMCGLCSPAKPKNYHHDRLIDSMTHAQTNTADIPPDNFPLLIMQIDNLLEARSKE